MNIQKKDYLVVGDAFNAFSKTVDNVLTETEVLEQMLTSAKIDTEVHLHLQQGVDAGMIRQAIESYQARNKLNNSGIFIHIGDQMPRALKRQAHKHRAENITVSSPRQISDTLFEMDLHFTCQNELFQDHLTGLHIQGMAITECGRQAFLVVTEEFFLKNKNRDHYFVIKHMNVEFVNFLFPLSSTLEYQIIRHSEKADRDSFDAQITVRQNETVCATMTVSFTAFEAATINQREAVLATERAHEFLSRCAGKIAAIPEVFVPAQGAA